MASIYSRWALAGAAITMLAGIPATSATSAPANAWTVEYGETQCSAQRTFGEGEDALSLALRPALDGASYEVTILGPEGAAQIPEQIAGKVDFGHGSIKPWVLKHRDPASGRQVHRFRVPTSAITPPAGSGKVAFAARSYRANLDALNLGAAIAALDTCLKDLRTYWNASSAEGAAAARSSDDVESLLKPANHVDSEMWGGVRGSAQYILFIDPAGKLAGCEAVSDDASPILGVLGCDILRQRGRFTPALDSKGNPIRNVIVTSQVRWKFG